MANIIGPKVTANVSFIDGVQINCIVSSSKAQCLCYHLSVPVCIDPLARLTTYAMTETIVL